ncbi:MAG: DUF2924 domain-containing protein [Pseudomonadota bacterium]
MITVESVSDLARLPRCDLKSLWVAEFRADPAPRISSPMMARIIFNALQWKTSGQSRDRYVKRLRRAHRASAKPGSVAKPGARLVRDWHGRQHVVDVLPDGYLWNGRTWRSLSAIAKEITGTKWSGPRFFGVAG